MIINPAAQLSLAFLKSLFWRLGLSLTTLTVQIHPFTRHICVVLLLAHTCHIHTWKDANLQDYGEQEPGSKTKTKTEYRRWRK